MDLVSLLILVIVFGIFFYLIQTVIPMPPPFKTAALVILSLILVMYLLDGLHAGHFRLFVNDHR